MCEKCGKLILGKLRILKWGNMRIKLCNECYGGITDIEDLEGVFERRRFNNF